MKNRMRLLATYLVVVFTVFLFCGAVSLSANLSSPGMELRGAGDTLKGDGIEGGNPCSGQGGFGATSFVSIDAQRIDGLCRREYNEKKRNG